VTALARAGAQRRSPRKRPRAHAESGTKRRRHIAQHVPAARTPAVIADRASSVRAEPVPAQVACWIDALNGETGQILHRLPPPAALHRASAFPTEEQNLGANCGAGQLWCQDKTPQDIGVPLQNPKKVWKCTRPRPVAYGLMQVPALHRARSAVAQSACFKKPLADAPTGLVVVYCVESFGGTKTAEVQLAVLRLVALRPVSRIRDYFPRQGAAALSRPPAIRRGGPSRDPAPAACR